MIGESHETKTQEIVGVIKMITFPAKPKLAATKSSTTEVPKRVAVVVLTEKMEETVSKSRTIEMAASKAVTEMMVDSKVATEMTAALRVIVAEAIIGILGAAKIEEIAVLAAETHINLSASPSQIISVRTTQRTTGIRDLNILEMVINRKSECLKFSSFYAFVRDLKPQSILKFAPLLEKIMNNSF